MKPQIIVCGLGRTGYRIFALLMQQGAQVVGISTVPLSNAQGKIVVGDMRAASTLLAAGIMEAHTLVLANSDDALNLGILTQARLINPHIRIINRLFNAGLGDRLDRTLPHHVSMSVAALAAPLFTFAALGNRAIGQISLFEGTWPIHEELIDDQHPWCGLMLKSLWENRTRMLIYYLPVDRQMDLVSAVTHEVRLATGDRVIVATKPSVQRSRRFWRKQWQMLLSSLSQFRRKSRSGLLVLLALFSTIAVASITYISLEMNTSFVDALYFSVGMITGAGGMEQVAEQSPSLVKLFTAIMMLVGAGVIGICYALLNDFILGTHLQQLWNTARLPQRQHYIVCGLGGVGYQIVSQLHGMGYDVVVIEHDPNGRFLHAVRSLKLPVILGDATVASTLDMANVKTAAALLAVTSDDTINLEIALSSKGIFPRLPVVVRTHDSAFATQVQQVFEFEMVMSPTELAAPAFAAAAIGGRIFGNGMMANSLWVAIATLITPGHPFFGKTVQAVATTSDLVPLYIESGETQIHGLALLDYMLSNNDVLYLTMPANRLDQLWRHTSSSLIAG
ncbi:MAG: NAD-binding protein [Cyanobacteria bacterium J06635_15]